MKNVQFATALVLMAAVAVFMPSCKKEVKKKTVLTSYTDSTNAVTRTLTYDVSGKVIKYTDDGNISLDYYYGTDNNIVTRTTADATTIAMVDSFRYDTQNRILRIESYETKFGAMIKSTVFTYNGDNTVNSVTVHYTVPSSNDELYNYSYEGGYLKKREDMVKIGGLYKTKQTIEFLAYDNHSNPFKDIYSKYTPDMFLRTPFEWAMPYNPTSMKLSSYDIATGSVTNVISASGVYTYNGDGLPASVIFNQGANTLVFKFAYQQI